MKIMDAEVSGHWIPEQMNMIPEGERAPTISIMENIKAN